MDRNDYYMGALAADDAYRGDDPPWPKPPPDSPWARGVALAGDYAGRDTPPASATEAPPEMGSLLGMGRAGEVAKKAGQGFVRAVDYYAGMPKRVYEGAQPETPGRPSEDDDWRTQKLADAAYEWGPSTAFGMVFDPFGVKRSVGVGGVTLGSGAGSGSKIIQPSENLVTPRAANANVSQAEVIAGLPPPLSLSERTWQNYVRRMTPEEMITSEPVWSAAADLSRAKGLSPSEAFAEVSNDMYGRMGANKFMTPQQAKLEMARQRGISAVPEAHYSPIHAYHSSPHDFDKFDLSKIGTGEGAQSYGHGIYAAENPAVSGQGGQYWEQFARNRFAYSPTPEGMATRALLDTKADRPAAIAKLSDPKYQTFLKDFLPNSYFKNVDPREALKLLESGQPVGPRTYEVAIHAKPEQLLDWDKPLREQPVAEAVRSIVPRDLRGPFDANVESGISGANAYHNYVPGERYSTRETRTSPYIASNAKTMGEALQIAGNDPGRVLRIRDPSFVSGSLNEAGIPGIRYLDQGSRGAGTGSSNYVVFDPERIRILKKYGLAGAVPTMGALAAEDRYAE